MSFRKYMVFYKILIILFVFISTIWLFSCSSSEEKMIDFNELAVGFENQEYIYDGNEKSIHISGDLPDDLNVTYEGNNKTDVGTYDVIAHFSSSNNRYTNLTDKTAKMIIKKANFD